MKKQTFILFTVLLVPVIFSWTISQDKWIVEKQNGYFLYYTTSDKHNIIEYKTYFEDGKKAVENFFQSSFKHDFNIYIHTSRESLESAWQKDWNMPDFKSECWMVASGIADKFDIISPKMWDNLACEHIYSDTIKTQNLITHELIHVFHGQQNKSPDFNDITGIDWFVEGLATYASGQCDSIRILDVKKALLDNKIPESLNKFWAGNLRYGLSGTVVMYLDNKYGREKLTSLLEYNTLIEVLNSLETSELEIMDGWKRYIKEL